MPLDTKEKDEIKGSTCCAFDLPPGPAASRQASWYLTPRWEGRTQQRKDDQSHSDAPRDSRLVWVNVWVLLGGPCGRAAPFPLSGLWKRNPQWKTLLWKWAVKLVEEKQKWFIFALICEQVGLYHLNPAHHRRAIWSQLWQYGIGGGSVWTSSEGKPSLPHSRDSWEIHPTSKQTDVTMREQSSSILIAYRGQLTCETWRGTEFWSSRQRAEIWH